MTPCSPLSFNRRFGGTYRLHLQGRRNRFSKPASKQVTSVISQKMILFITTAVKTSSSKYENCWKRCFLCGPCREFFVVSSYKPSINPIVNPDPVSGHLHVTIYTQNYSYCASFCAILDEFVTLRCTY
jgi:hypothetical protein